MTTPRKLLTAAVALAASAALAAPAASAASTVPEGARDTSALSCAKGYFCVYLGSFLVDQFPAGESRTYGNGGLPATGLANGTNLTYCVTGSTWYGVAPGGSSEHQDVITALTPTSGMMCLS